MHLFLVQLFTMGDIGYWWWEEFSIFSEISRLLFWWMSFTLFSETRVTSKFRKDGLTTPSIPVVKSCRNWHLKTWCLNSLSGCSLFHSNSCDYQCINSTCFSVFRYDWSVISKVAEDHLLDRVIGGHMGLEYVDIFTSLLSRNMRSILTNILALLGEMDLIR